jgi:kynurenine formamidase
MDVDRRQVFAAVALSGALALTYGRAAGAAPVDSGIKKVRFGTNDLSILDLTHRLTSDFNFDRARPRIAMEAVEGSGAAVGMRMNRLALLEHTGTHIDAPSHFGPNLKSMGEIPLQDLAVPLVVIDIAAKAASSRNARVEVADILEWEKRHGRMPSGCCVAMYSAWRPIEETARNLAEGRYSSTGFSLEAATFLGEHRSVKGLAVDSLTFEAGPDVPAYPIHQYWLRGGRWGIEGIANLERAPRAGALLIVGAPPIQNATGTPVRALALF